MAITSYCSIYTFATATLAILKRLPYCSRFSGIFFGIFIFLLIHLRKKEVINIHIYLSISHAQSVLIILITSLDRNNFIVSFWPFNLTVYYIYNMSSNMSCNLLSLPLQLNPTWRSSKTCFKTGISNQTRKNKTDCQIRYNINHDLIDWSCTCLYFCNLLTPKIFKTAKLINNGKSRFSLNAVAKAHIIFMSKIFISSALVLALATAEKPHSHTPKKTSLARLVRFYATCSSFCFFRDST